MQQLASLGTPGEEGAVSQEERWKWGFPLGGEVVT